MSKIDDHAVALALVREARTQLDGSVLVIGETYGGDGSEMPSLFFALCRLENGKPGTRLEVSNRLAALLGAAFAELAGDLQDKAIQLAEAAERDARDAAVTEAESFLLLARAARL